MIVYLDGLAWLDMSRGYVPLPSALLLRFLDQEDFRSSVVLAQDHADRDVRDVVEDADPAASCNASSIAWVEYGPIRGPSLGLQNWNFSYSVLGTAFHFNDLRIRLRHYKMWAKIEDLEISYN